MQKTITITYNYGEQLAQSANYQYHIQLSDNDNFKVDYFTGKQRDTQMDALALALKDALPDSAIIKQVNQVAFNATKVSMLDMLRRKDDYLATVLFEAAESAATTSDAAKPTEQPKAVDSAVKSETAAPRIIEYQPANTRGYHELDLNETEPAATDKVRKIGISRLSYVFNYNDLKSILKTTKADLFTLPLGVVPSNGKITETRKNTFSSNAGLDTHALQDAKEIFLGNVHNSNNGNEYHMYAFKPAKTTNTTEAVTTESEPAPSATSAVAGTTHTAVSTNTTNEPAAATAPTDAAMVANATSMITPTNTTNEPAAATAPTNAANDSSVATDSADKDVVPDIFKHYTKDPFNVSTNAPAKPAVQEPFKAAQPTTAAVAPTTVPKPGSPISQPNWMNDSTLTDQLDQINDKLNTLIMNSNNATSPAQTNNDLLVLLNDVKLKLSEVATQNSNPANSELAEIKQQVAQILQNQTNAKPHAPETLNELILQESNLTDADMNQIPDRIKNFCFKHNEAMPYERANYIFDIVNYLKDTINIPEDLKCLSDPELFLKVVHLLSWFN